MEDGGKRLRVKVETAAFEFGSQWHHGQQYGCITRMNRSSHALLSTQKPCPTLLESCLLHLPCPLLPVRDTSRLLQSGNPEQYNEVLSSRFHDNKLPSLERQLCPILGHVKVGSKVDRGILRSPRHGRRRVIFVAGCRLCCAYEVARGARGHCIRRL